MNQSDLLALLQELLSHSQETEWIEFKQNWANPEDIGEYVSALANAAALCGKRAGYLVWGVEDQSKRIVGTDFRPRRAKKGNEELEGWLLRFLWPQVDLRIHEFQYQGRHLVIFEVPPASRYPVSFKGVEYIRVGSQKRRLPAHPEKERKLWQVLAAVAFEEQAASHPLSSEEVLQRIDYPSCFQLLGFPLPDNRAGILERLRQEKVLIAQGEDRFLVTNLGAILFARSLDDFGRLARKKLRVVQYQGKNRVKTQREWVLGSGYAVGFANAISYILNLLPRNEEIQQAFRRDVPMFPEIAVRELVANALIHQDFCMTGTGPMVEIFVDRVEITNPGAPLIDTLRFIDEPPQVTERNAGFHHAENEHLRRTRERGG